MAHAPFRYGQDARTAWCEKHDTGVPGWSWKRHHIPNAMFEDWGNMPPGIPPLGLRLQARVIRKLTRNIATRPVNINVIYSVIYDEVTGTIHLGANPHQHARDKGGEYAPSEPYSKRIHYTDWPEGVLKSLCSECDISNFCEKSELVARLEQFDKAEAELHVGAGENAPQAPKESTALRNKLAPLTYTLEWPTPITASKQMLYEDTGIPSWPAAPSVW
jgi:hypothetical protein